MLIYHVIPNDEWKIVKTKTSYEPIDLEKEHFIHFSFKDKIEEVANGVYNDFSKLTILEVDSDKLVNADKFKVEDLFELGNEYPHLYAPLNLSAIVNTYEIVQQENLFKIHF